jgi:hypothetical protein
MQLIIYHPAASAVWADALFASVLQCSDNPSAGQVRKAIAAAVRAYGGLPRQATPSVASLPRWLLAG